MKSPNILLSLAATVSTYQGVAVPKRYCHVKKDRFSNFCGRNAGASKYTL